MAAGVMARHHLEAKSKPKKGHSMRRDAQPVPLSTTLQHRHAYSTNPLRQCQWIDFSVIHDVPDDLSVIKASKQIPFEVKHVFLLYDIPAIAEPGGNAHHELIQVFVSMSGSFDLHLDDGVEKRTVHLCREKSWLSRPPMELVHAKELLKGCGLPDTREPAL